MKVDSNAQLKKLFKATTFADSDDCSWDGMSIDKVGADEQDSYPLGAHVHVPECSCLGQTMITLTDTYERSGEDCLLIQELVRLAKEGRLLVVPPHGKARK